MAFGQIGSLIGGGLMNYAGQREANRTNRDIANQASWANAAEARKNRDFQERMSNTSHQREVADLEAAGLNPLISATGGSSTPGGATATAATTQVQNEVGAGLTSAMEMANLQLNAKKQKQEISNMKTAKSKMAAEKVAVEKLGLLHETNAKSTQQNMTIKGPAERAGDTLNWLFDAIGNKESKFKTSNPLGHKLQQPTKKKNYNPYRHRKQ